MKCSLVYLSGDILGADGAELRCLHDHDGVVVEPLDDVLVDYVLVLTLHVQYMYSMRQHFNFVFRWRPNF